MASKMGRIVSPFRQKNMLVRSGFKLLNDFKLEGKYCVLRPKFIAGLYSSSTDGLNENVLQRSDIYHDKAKKAEIRNQRLIKVAIIGEPNCGKSTFVNSLVGEKVFAVTEKPHTTRHGAQAAFTVGNTQVVLLDTPGVVTISEGRRLKMTREHLSAPEYALQSADIICVLSDSADKRIRHRIHSQVLKALERHKQIPSVLILNKVDKLRHKMDLLGLAAELSEQREKDEWGYVDKGGWGSFDNIFMISALQHDGIDDIKDYLAIKAKPGEWLFPPDAVCDLSPEERIFEVFREKLLQLYEHEIPWQVKQVNVFCEERSQGILRIHQKLFCRKKSQRRCILEKLNILKNLVYSELKEIFQCELDITIDVTVSEKVGFQTPLPSY